MYTILEDLLRMKRIPKTSVSDLLGVTPKTLNSKIHRRSDNEGQEKRPDFGLQEAIKIRNCFFPEYKFDYVFEEDTDRVEE